MTQNWVNISHKDGVRELYLETIDTWPIVGLRLRQRPSRWTNMNRALLECLAFKRWQVPCFSAGFFITEHIDSLFFVLVHLLQRWSNIRSTSQESCLPPCITEWCVTLHCSSNRETLTQCCFDAGPASKQHRVQVLTCPYNIPTWLGSYFLGFTGTDRASIVCPLTPKTCRRPWSVFHSPVVAVHAAISRRRH